MTRLTVRSLAEHFSLSIISASANRKGEQEEGTSLGEASWELYANEKSHTRRCQENDFSHLFKHSHRSSSTCRLIARKPSALSASASFFHRKTSKQNLQNEYFRANTSKGNFQSENFHTKTGKRLHKISQGDLQPVITQFELLAFIFCYCLIDHKRFKTRVSFNDLELGVCSAFAFGAMIRLVIRSAQCVLESKVRFSRFKCELHIVHMLQILNGLFRSLFAIGADPPRVALQPPIHSQPMRVLEEPLVPLISISPSLWSIKTVYLGLFSINYWPIRRRQRRQFTI